MCHQQLKKFAVRQQGSLKSSDDALTHWCLKKSDWWCQWFIKNFLSIHLSICMINDLPNFIIKVYFIRGFWFQCAAFYGYGHFQLLIMNRTLFPSVPSVAHPSSHKSNKSIPFLQYIQYIILDDKSSVLQMLNFYFWDTCTMLWCEQEYKHCRILMLIHVQYLFKFEEQGHAINHNMKGIYLK